MPPKTPTPSQSDRPWIIYTRVSTDEQAKEGVSLDAQRFSCEMCLKSQGITSFEHISDEGFSGKTLKRPGMGEILRRVERGDVAGVCFYALDRLTRSRRDIHHIVDVLEKGNADMLGVRDKLDTSGPGGRFVLHLMANLANLEVETNSARVKHAYSQIRAAGGHPHEPPVGCILDRGADHIPRLAPHPQHGPIVAKVWDKLAAGDTLQSVCDYLRDQGVPTHRGTPWSKPNLHNLVKSRYVVGVLTDLDTWQRAQTALSARRNGARRDLSVAPVPSPQATHGSALPGLCWCARCGSAMVLGSGTSRNGTSYAYLRCSGRMKLGRHYCDAPDLPAPAVESAIVNHLRTWADGPGVAATLGQWLAERTRHLDASLASLPEIRKRRDDATRKSKMILEVVEEGGMPPRLAAERLRELQVEIDKAEAEILALSSSSDLLDHHRAMAEAFPDRLRAALAHFNEIEVEQRRDVLRGIIGKITIDRERGADITLTIPGAGKAPAPGSSDRSMWRAELNAVRTNFRWQWKIGEGRALRILSMSAS